MNVHELNHDQIMKLKTDLYYKSSIYEDLNDEDKSFCDNAELPEDIPTKLIYKVFDRFNFVEEDF